MKCYLVKKGPADPFRGDWYIHEAEFIELEKAIQSAATLTFTNYLELKNSWGEFGYEWSVFEKNEPYEKKIWEGYKYIQEIKDAKVSDHFDQGLV
jgi:hypothetical protein